MNRQFDLLAPLYDRLFRPTRTPQLRDLLKLPTDGWLLDCGGGTGRVSARLRPFVTHLVVCDLSQGMLRRTLSKGDLWPVRARAERLPFPDASFERILVVDALHHFPDQQTALGELVRVLMPGGRLVIEEPDIAHWGVKLVALAEKLALMGSHFSAPAGIIGLLAAHGLRAHLQSDSPSSFWIIAEKN